VVRIAEFARAQQKVLSGEAAEFSYLARFTMKLGVVSRTKTAVVLMCPLFVPV
jgi:hypothetical protein